MIGMYGCAPWSIHVRMLQIFSPQFLYFRNHAVAVGVFLLVVRGTLLAKILQNNLRILMVSILLLELISWLWKGISGNTTSLLSPSFRLPTIVTDAATKLLLWKLTTLLMLVVRKLFTIIASSRNSIPPQGTKTGIRALEHRITFCKNCGNATMKKGHPSLSYTDTAYTIYNHHEG